MNKNTFRSAYSKLALSEGKKRYMKDKLLEQMNTVGNIELSEEYADFHRAQEIKFTERKRSPLKTAIAVGSSAAAVALCATGAVFLLNGRPFTQQNNTYTAEVQSAEASTEVESAEIFTELETDEAYIEDKYYSQRCANGILHFQEFTETSAEYSKPENAMEEEEFFRLLSEQYNYIRYRLGMDKEYAKEVDTIREVNSRLEGTDPDQADNMVAALPLGDELWLSECYYDDTGIAMVYRSEDGTKQVNFSASDDPEEFLPIDLPEGGYLTPMGEYRSKFTLREYETRFIDPEMFSMAVGNVTVGECDYYTAVYSCNVYDFGMKYFRIDGKNITQEQFINCIDRESFANTDDHIGFYVDDGLNYDTFTMYGQVEDDRCIAPGASIVKTEWGELNMNVVTNQYPSWDGGIPRTIYNFGSEQVPDEYNYTVSDAADFAGLDVLNEQIIPEEYDDRVVCYKASYAEIPNNWINGAGFGANHEILPGDDPQEFEESRRFVGGEDYSEPGDEGINDFSYYMTDKIDYFKNKTRTMAIYSVRALNESQSQRIVIDVFDNWEIYEYMKVGLFARLPAVKTKEFAGVKGELYVCGGPLRANETYIGGFKTANGRYVVVQTTNVDLTDFAEILAKLYTNSSEPEKQ